MSKWHVYIAPSKTGNIMVVGGTGSGKTTFLNAMLDSVAKKTPADRIMLIQDTDEIQCNAANYEALMTVPKVYDMEDLLRHTMRRSPGRIIVGEVRGPEAHALVKAWNTGHPGGLGTIHADSAVEGLTRIEDLIEENPNRRAKPWNIAQAVNVLVYIEKEETGQRRRMVKNVLRVKGYDKVAQKYEVETL
ncbi:ATPase, T2SS/T4P/T4SS family [Undibacterium arcticum]|uniref:ATPase, T2SS/T4P/T4SS family n=1 Tax=Undibacterium arcticum TaxID=1762892 RepID=UPI003610616C